MRARGARRWPARRPWSRSSSGCSTPALTVATRSIGGRRRPASIAPALVDPGRAACPVEARPCPTPDLSAGGGQAADDPEPDDDEDRDRDAEQTPVTEARGPIAAATTRVTGVTMTATSPSHRNDAGSSVETSAMIAPGSSLGPPSSGEIPSTHHEHDADGQEPDGQVGDDDESAADPRLVRPGRPTLATGHPIARRSIWTAVYSRTTTNSSAASAGRCAARSATTDRRPQEHADRGRAGDVRVDLAAQQVDRRRRLPP